MPTWICPTCFAKLKVNQSRIGEAEVCETCGTSSIIFDAAEIAAMMAPPVPPITLPTSSPVSSTTIRNIRNEAPLLITIWRGVHVVLFLATLGLAVYFNNKHGSSVWNLVAVGIFVSLVLWWPVYEFMSDVFRCRRLLEEIAKK